jgi:hypothetical protein
MCALVRLQNDMSDAYVTVTVKNAQIEKPPTILETGDRHRASLRTLRIAQWRRGYGKSTQDQHIPYGGNRGGECRRRLKTAKADADANIIEKPAHHNGYDYAKIKKTKNEHKITEEHEGAHARPTRTTSLGMPYETTKRRCSSKTRFNAQEMEYPRA